MEVHERLCQIMWKGLTFWEHSTAKLRRVTQMGHLYSSIISVSTISVMIQLQVCHLDMECGEGLFTHSLNNNPGGVVNFRTAQIHVT